MTISTVGAQANNGGTGISTLNVAPTAIGDALILWITSQDPTSGAGVTGVSGGGATWTRATSYFDTATTTYADTWLGVITATGAATITATGLPGTTEFTVMAAQQFTKTDPGPWSVVASSPAPSSSGPSLGSGTAIAWPSLTAAGASSYLYAGNGVSVFGTLNAGSTPGYTYPFTGFSSNRPVFNQAFTGTGFPTSAQTNTGAYDTVAAIIGAGSPPPASAPSVFMPDLHDRPFRRKLWE